MNVFITGITGTLGQTVSRMLLELGHGVIGYSRDEQKQRQLPAHQNLVLHLGDVRDRDRLVALTRSCDVIMHFASLKCVDTLEANPDEAIRTIVTGTQNVLQAQRVNAVPRVLLTSTDKAVYPINVYGAAKMMAERLVLQHPENVVCRYGNVLGSRGSVLPMFIKTLSTAEPYVEYTDPKMTRFWTTVERAARFVIGACGGRPGLQCPTMSAAPVVDVASEVALQLGVSVFEERITGIRPGEKLHECLFTRNETDDGRDLYSNDVHMADGELKSLLEEAMFGRT